MSATAPPDVRFDLDRHRYERRALTYYTGLHTDVHTTPAEDLLTDPELAPAFVGWLDGMARLFPEAGPWNRPDQCLFVPFTGTPDAAPVTTGTEAAQIIQMPAQAATSKPSGNPPRTAPETAWVDLHTRVHVDVFRRYRPEWAMRIVAARRLISDTGDIYATPTFLATIMGAKDAKTVRRWFREGRFDDDLVVKKVEWRENKEGVMTEYWALDVRPINLIDKVDEHGKPVLKADGTPAKTVATPGDRFVKVPHNWYWQDPATTCGTTWVRRAKVTPGAAWVAAVLLIKAAGRGGYQGGVKHIAAEFGMSKSQWDFHAKVAENEGLYTTPGGRSGRGAAYRKPMAVTTQATTIKTRQPNQKFENPWTDLPEPVEHDPTDPPF